MKICERLIQWRTISVVLVAATAVCLVETPLIGRSSDPATVAQAYWSNVGSGDFAAAYRLLSAKWKQDVTVSMFQKYAKNCLEFRRPASDFRTARIIRLKATVAFKLNGANHELFLEKDNGIWQLASPTILKPADWIESPTADQKVVWTVTRNYTETRLKRDYVSAYNLFSPSTRQNVTYKDFVAWVALPSKATSRYYIKFLAEPEIHGASASVPVFVVSWRTTGGEKELQYGPMPLEKANGTWWVSIPPDMRSRWKKRPQ